MGILHRRGEQTDTAMNLVISHARRKKSAVSLEKEGRLIEVMILGSSSMTLPAAEVGGVVTSGVGGVEKSGDKELSLTTLGGCTVVVQTTRVSSRLIRTTGVCENSWLPLPVVLINTGSLYQTSSCLAGH